MNKENTQHTPSGSYIFIFWLKLSQIRPMPACQKLLLPPIRVKTAIFPLAVALSPFRVAHLRRPRRRRVPSTIFGPASFGLR